jgi:hypothetical protein
VIIVNENTYAVRVNVDGSSITVAAAATSAPMYFVPSDSNNDNFEIASVANPGCGEANDGGYNLAAPHRYSMEIINDPGVCHIGKTIVDAPTQGPGPFTQIS